MSGQRRSLRCGVSGTAAFAVLAFALASAAAPRTVAAALGDDVATIATDGAHLRSAVRVERGARYDTHELAAPTGTVVREYASPAGKIFAVSWEGPWPPDLRQLLGRYFDRFSAHAAAGRRGRGPLIVDEPDLVIVWSGHPRAFHGRAYLRSLVPVDVDAATVR